MIIILAWVVVMGDCVFVCLCVCVSVCMYWGSQGAELALALGCS